MQLHTENRCFKDNTPEVGAVFGLLPKKLDIGTDFDKFIEKPNSYVERKLNNTKDVMCAVTAMVDPTKTFEEDNMPKYLDEYETKSIMKKKRL